MKERILTLAALVGLASTTLAHDPKINELYVSHTGTDDQEFVEIIWDGLATMNGLMLLVVEGDASSSLTGGLDVAIDFSSQQMPADGYFVVGTSGTANLDMDVGPDNVFENGTETFYLISTSNTAAILALVGTDVDADDDLITDIATMAGVTIIDIVALTDGAAGAEVYDGAPTLGPDGSFLPAGIYRGNDSPNGWCTSSYLDFALAADRTPGAMNIPCPVVAPGTGFCDGSTGNCPCVAIGAAGHGCPNTNPNGSGALLEGTGSASFGLDTLSFVISDGAPSKPGIMIQGPSALNYPNGNATIPNASGLFCVNPTLRGGVVFTDANGDATITDFQGMPFGATAQPSGSTTYYQYWFRDPGNPCQNAPASAAAFSFSNGYEIDWM